MDFYQVLEVEKDASFNQVKAAYQRMVLQHHPDKKKDDQDGENGQFLRIQEAWETLKDEERRKQYDISLEAQRLKQRGPMTAEVDLDEMVYHEEGEYRYRCRCGGDYVISEKDLENGCEIVGCNNCSLLIKVLYSVEFD